MEDGHRQCPVALQPRELSAPPAVRNDGQCQHLGNSPFFERTADLLVEGA